MQYKDIGIIASLPSVYENGQKQRTFNKLEKELAKNSEHVGTLSERNEFTVESNGIRNIFGEAVVIYMLLKKVILI